MLNRRARTRHPQDDQEGGRTQCLSRHLKSPPRPPGQSHRLMRKRGTRVALRRGSWDAKNGPGVPQDDLERDTPICISLAEVTTSTFGLALSESCCADGKSSQSSDVSGTATGQCCSSQAIAELRVLNLSTPATPAIAYHGVMWPLEWPRSSKTRMRRAAAIVAVILAPNALHVRADVPSIRKVTNPYRACNNRI